MTALFCYRFENTAQNIRVLCVVFYFDLIL